MRFFALCSAVILFSCSSAGNTEQLKHEYDSLTSLQSQHERAIKSTKDLYESMKTINPDSTNLWLLRQIDSLTVANKRIEERRNELRGKIF